MRYKTAGGLVDKPRRWDFKYTVIAVAIILIAITAALFAFNPAPTKTTTPPPPPPPSVMTCNDTCFMSGQWNQTMFTTYTNGVLSLSGVIVYSVATNTSLYLGMQNIRANSGQNDSLMRFSLQPSVSNFTFNLRSISVTDLNATSAVTYVSKCLGGSCPISAPYIGMMIQYTLHFNARDMFQIKVTTTTSTTTYDVKFQ